ncbi:MAG: putative Carboxylesterase [Myxococcales bacterium]|nr:putative Carboxylesterase [Myxococcales bacterium]
MTAGDDALVELGGLRAISVGDRAAARVVVILAHGFQMEPGDLSPFAHSIQAPAWFLFPEAPGVAEPRGRAWWHIDAKKRGEAMSRGPRDFMGEHPPDLPAARARLLSFIDAVRAEVGTRPLVVGGFSQGGMLTCDSVLRARLAVDALVLFSASRICFDEWRPLLEGAPLRGLTALVSHGRADDDLSFAAGEALRDCLTAAGADVAWVPFDEGHQIPLLVWRHLRRLLLALARRPP